jgi:hypothetical protein
MPPGNLGEWREFAPPVDEPDRIVERFKLVAVAALVAIAAALVLTGQPSRPALLNTTTGGVHEPGPPSAASSHEPQ